MSKRTFVIFGAFAVCFGLLLPYWAISKEGGESASPGRVEASLEEGKELFAVNCGACHTLAKGGTDGIVGPDLDQLLGVGEPEANTERVLNAVENGIGGRMPAGILTGEDADTVADFVARTAGQ
jgi:mono/diheme cytochrome c family protein